jgi:hypothetical protein
MNLDKSMNKLISLAIQNLNIIQDAAAFSLTIFEQMIDFLLKTDHCSVVLIRYQRECPLGPMMT